MLKLYLAPMEELTGYVFRNTISRHFGYIDKYFTPFISPDNRIMKTRAKREIIPSNNEGLDVVPQLLANDPALFLEGAALFENLGYKEVNINFGCPSNTVTAKRKGSGILRDPDLMDSFLDGIFNANKTSLKISVKTRVGYGDASDLENVIKVLSRYPFSEIIIHPRLKKDMYEGAPRMDLFYDACRHLDRDIVYNGDITSLTSYNALTADLSEYDNISGVMIGRGAITYPGIFRQVRTGKAMTINELYDFLHDLSDTYEKECGSGNALAKMKEVMTYVCRLISDDKDRAKILKTMIKSSDPGRLKDALTVAKSHIANGLSQIESET